MGLETKARICNKMKIERKQEKAKMRLSYEAVSLFMNVRVWKSNKRRLTHENSHKDRKQ